MHALLIIITYLVTDSVAAARCGLRDERGVRTTTRTTTVWNTTEKYFSDSLAIHRVSILWP
mgnify:CR=1 FL=1